MAIVTEQQLIDAGLDCDSIETFVNGAASPGTFMTRLGTTLKTLAKIQADFELTPQIADGTAAAPGLSFASQPDTGIYRPAANTLSISAQGFEVARFVGTADGAYFQFNSSSGTPTLRPNGAASDIVLAVGSKGAANILFYTNTFSQQQMEILHTASAVNRLTLTGSPTGSGVSIVPAGSDTNIDLLLGVKGSARHRFQSGSASSVEIFCNASYANYLALQGALTGTAPTIQATGSDTNVGLQFQAKGTGEYSFFGNLTVQQFGIGFVSGATGYLKAVASSVGLPSLQVAGSDSNIGLAFVTKGTFGFRFDCGVNNASFDIDYVASAANRPAALGATAGNAAILTAKGSDTNAGLKISAKAAEGVYLCSFSGTDIQFSTSHTSFAVNRINATGSATGSDPVLSVAGSDTNRDLILAGKGTGKPKVAVSTGYGFLVGGTTIASGSFPAAATLDIAIPSGFSHIGIFFESASCNTATREFQIRGSTDGGSSFSSLATDYRGTKQQDGTVAAKARASFVEHATGTAASVRTGSCMLFGYNDFSYTQFQSFINDGVTMWSNIGQGVFPGLDAIRFQWDGSGNFDGGTYKVVGFP